MIEIRNLLKQFGPITAVDGVTFDVGRGEVLGFLGPNGAGKSTTMKMITGFLTPTDGTAVVCGHDVLADPIAAKRCIGYLPEGAPLYPDMTPAGLLSFVAEVRGLKGAEGKRRIDEVVERVSLRGVLHQRIETLSKGFKRRVGLAQAILHDPPVLILDEPTDGLDPNQKHEVRDLIREMAADKAIVLSTHILEEVEAVCTRVIVIHKGKVVLDEKPDQMIARSRYHNAVALRVRAELSGTLERELRALEAVAAVEQAGPAGDGLVDYVIFPKNGTTILPAISERLRQADWRVDAVRLESGRLDEVFRDLTAGRESAAETELARS